MRFDDRLMTVLNQPADDRHDAAVRWRQLVDLVARAGSNSTSPMVAEAIQAIRGEAPNVDETLRAAAARSIAALPLPWSLLEYFASDNLTVSAPVLAAASLDTHQWKALDRIADEETRRFIATLHPELQTERPETPAAPVEEAPAFVLPQAPVVEPVSEPSTYAPPSLHEVVERIEQRRRMRSAQTGRPAPAEMPAPTEAPALFRWECGPGGEIAWVEGAPRGPLIGRSIAKVLENERDSVDAEVVRAFAIRAPFRDALLKVGGTGPVAGEWKISGVPAFEPADGRFAGYRGVALREEPEAALASVRDTVADVLSDPDSLRELVHEIKTPLNAIIGFAEIIEGQYLGPADRGYRDRAGEIVRQARMLLTAIDDLDFAAKVHSATGAARERLDLAALVQRESRELRQLASRRGLELELALPRMDVPARVQPELADRLLFRLFGALAECSQRGERLQLVAELMADKARISMTKPQAIRGFSDSDLFEAHRREPMQTGFALRLARGLARIAGGDLVSSRDTFALVFPRG